VVPNHGDPTLADFVAVVHVAPEDAVAFLKLTGLLAEETHERAGSLSGNGETDGPDVRGRYLSIIVLILSDATDGDRLTVNGRDPCLVGASVTPCHSVSGLEASGGYKLRDVLVSEVVRDVGEILSDGLSD
jgi:hypothetical protein